MTLTQKTGKGCLKMILEIVQTHTLPKQKHFYTPLREGKYNIYTEVTHNGKEINGNGWSHVLLHMSRHEALGWRVKLSPHWSIRTLVARLEHDTPVLALALEWTAVFRQAMVQVLLKSINPTLWEV